jgi:hypothetical protein
MSALMYCGCGSSGVPPCLSSLRFLDTASCSRRTTTRDCTHGAVVSVDIANARCARPEGEEGEVHLLGESEEHVGHGLGVLAAALDVGNVPKHLLELHQRLGRIV